MNKLVAEAMLYIVSILRLGESTALPCPLDNDSKDRMLMCLQVLARPEDEVTQVGGKDRMFMCLQVLARAEDEVTQV